MMSDNATVYNFGDNNFTIGIGAYMKKDSFDKEKLAVVSEF